MVRKRPAKSLPTTRTRGRTRASYLGRERSPWRAVSRSRKRKMLSFSRVVGRERAGRTARPHESSRSCDGSEGLGGSGRGGGRRDYRRISGGIWRPFVKMGQSLRKANRWG